jgi:hypothetical protein
MDVPGEEVRQLEAMVLESYTEGLRDMGWHGDPGLVRRGYRHSYAVRIA